MTEIAVSSGACRECGAQGNTWEGLCYQCMCAHGGFNGTVQSKNKYGAQPVDTSIGRCASKGEGNRAEELEALLRAGKIANLCHQVTYRLEVNGVYICSYRADSAYDEDGRHIVEDFKGKKTSGYQLKKRLMLACHGIEIRETGK